MLYNRGMIDTSLPFEELKARRYVNDRAKAGAVPDFSRRILRPGAVQLIVACAKIVPS